jgi:3-hydroxyacyl-CoA dehydrogenase/enoyl-CoA hydratase/3-hydroxybutyryl-CoA epimerase
MSEEMRYEKDGEGIVTIIMDMPGRSVNVINVEFGDAFGEMVDRVALDTGVKGVIIASAKKTFVAGAELDFLYKMEKPEETFALVQLMKARQRKLEKLGIPVVAAINGTALGGGWEVALATHHRVAIDDPRIKLGLPEVTLGLLPGDGGVTRMTRMLGLQAAFPFLTEGKQINPKEAKEIGLVDELATDAADMMAKARAWIKANPSSSQSWDRDDFRLPGGAPSSPKVAPALMVAPAMIRKKTQRNYPAPECIAAAMVEGAAVDFDTALRIESRYFSTIATGKVAKNMMSAFWFQLNAIKAGGSRPIGIAPTETKKIGVLGAGLMGHGIAYVTAVSGIEVVLKDMTQEKADAGKAAISELVGKRVTQGKMARADADAILERITATGEAKDLAGCDLVVEAVFEDRDLKAKVTKEAEAAMDQSGVFASNTSTLPITGLALASSRPEKFIGLHFFSPVHRMDLVEIIVGKKTDEATLAKAFDFVMKIGKTPIVVNDSRGFYTSRVFGTYVLEGLALLSEGQNAQAVESAGLKAGMPMGPLEVGDMVGISLMHHITEQTVKDMEALGQKYDLGPGELLAGRMVKEKGRNGKSAGAGFYDYPKEGGKSLWPETYKLFPPAEVKIPQSEMIDRLLFLQALETVRCRDEGVIKAVADANLGSILGWGFAPWAGGTLQYINSYSLKAFVARSKELAAKYGPRFDPPASLVTMAKTGKEFH